MDIIGKPWAKVVHSADIYSYSLRNAFKELVQWVNAVLFYTYLFAVFN